MTTTLLIFGYLGILFYLIIDIKDFDKKTPGLNMKETINLYFSLNAYLKIILAIIVVSVLIVIATTTGGSFVIKYMTADFMDGDTPAELMLYAFLLGAFWSVVVDKLTNILSKANHEIKING